MRNLAANEGKHSSQHIHDRWVFVGLLVLLVWAPLPLGSNRTWAIGILLVVSATLLAGAVFAWRSHAKLVQIRLHRFRYPIVLLMAMVVLSWLQTIPLPAYWVQTVSPVAAAAQSASDMMTLSVDVFQAQVMAGLAFAYLSVFLVTVLSVRDASRLGTLALVLVCSGVLQSVIGAALFSAHAEYQIFFVDVSHTRMIGTYVYHNSLAG